MKTSITLDEMQEYFKNHPTKDKSALTLINGMQVFFEFSTPDENNDVSLQLEVTAEHDKLPKDIEPTHVAAVLAATVLGSMSEVLMLAKILKE